MEAWGEHTYRVGTEAHYAVESPDDHVEAQRKHIEPWLSAVFQSEHLSLLLGSGFTRSVAASAGAPNAADMAGDLADFPFPFELEEAARASAVRMGRGRPNIEDNIRVALKLIDGLRILGRDDEAEELLERLNSTITAFLGDILQTERGIAGATSQETGPATGEEALIQLQSFLLSFASRTASRERLHVFTTNYDRIIEFGADLAGLHVLDRFVGALEPRFRSSRLNIDMHYNPPGIRGEPRYLEGVVQLTKLHGSLDWALDSKGWIRRIGLPFGAAADHPAVCTNPAETVMIYPNAAKDRDTAEYPYVDLFRDFAAAVCEPNSVLVTYGYGFGDDHINRALADMLTIPSAHLVIIAWQDEGQRVSRFCEQVGRGAQISLLIGQHFGALRNLVDHYLPKPAIDKITMRQTDLLRNRNQLMQGDAPATAGAGVTTGTPVPGQQTTAQAGGGTP